MERISVCVCKPVGYNVTRVEHTSCRETNGLPLTCALVYAEMVTSQPTAGSLLERSEVSLLLSPHFTEGDSVSVQVRACPVQTYILVLFCGLLSCVMVTNAEDVFTSYVLSLCGTPLH